MEEGGGNDHAVDHDTWPRTRNKPVSVFDIFSAPCKICGERVVDIDGGPVYVCDVGEDALRTDFEANLVGTVCFVCVEYYNKIQRFDCSTHSASPRWVDARDAYPDMYDSYRCSTIQQTLDASGLFDVTGARVLDDGECLERKAQDDTNVLERQIDFIGGFGPRKLDINMNALHPPLTHPGTTHTHAPWKKQRGKKHIAWHMPY